MKKNIELILIFVLLLTPLFFAMNGMKQRKIQPANFKPAFENDWDCCKSEAEKIEIIENKKRSLKKYIKRNFTN